MIKVDNVSLTIRKNEILKSVSVEFDKVGKKKMFASFAKLKKV